MFKHFSMLQVISSFILLLLVGLAGCGGGGGGNNNANLPSTIVSSVSPTEARVGDTITVSGENFGVTQGSSTLTISGVEATTITAWSDTEITAVIPTGAGSGNVAVNVSGFNSTPGVLIVPWETENPDNVAISVENSSQQFPVSVSDDSGGAIMVWADKRNGTDLDIYAQRVNSAGVVQWATNGVPIAIAANFQSIQNLVSDGNGGAIITWLDTRTGSFNIYAQRINNAGVVQWATNGVVVCNESGNKSATTMLPDGNGGAFVGWSDGRKDSGDTYIQHINSAGVAQWKNNGVEIASKSSIQGAPRLVSDGGDGAILVWHDGRSGAIGLYAQRVNSAGVAQWTAHGVPVDTGIGGQQSHQVISDNAGGAIVTWQTWPGADNYDIYAQRINGSGVVQWATDGVAISAAIGYQDYPTMTHDGSGGAIIAWQDSRNGAQWTDEDIYAQRVNSAGVVQWTADGVAISNATDIQYIPRIVSDDNGGAIMSWTDKSNGTNYNIYAQRINSAGAVQWTADGVAIRTAANSISIQSNSMTSDGSGGAIMVWGEQRNDAGDIYAQGITGSGLQ